MLVGTDSIFADIFTEPARMSNCYDLFMNEGAVFKTRHIVTELERIEIYLMKQMKKLLDACYPVGQYVYKYENCWEKF